MLEQICDYYYVAAERDWVIVCPGGGYCWISPREGAPIARAFAEAGYNAVVLRYTTLERQSESLGDKPTEELEALLAQLHQDYPPRLAST